MQRYISSAVVLLALALSGNVLAADGETVYNKACRMCHDSGMMGAPKLGDTRTWAPRLDKGDDALLKSVVDGLGSMPARGGCRDCDDAELVAAIDYIRDQSSQ